MILLCIKLIIFSALFYIALAASLENKVSVESPPDKVLLTEVQTITLHKDWCTAARRIPAISQLKCQGGSADGDCNSRAVNVAQCYYKGWDGYSIQWECKAEMGANYKFGKILVSCEGYDSAKDPYILRNSCGLTYELDYVNTPDNTVFYILLVTFTVAPFAFCLSYFYGRYCGIKNLKPDTTRYGSGTHHSYQSVYTPAVYYTSDFSSSYSGSAGYSSMGSSHVSSGFGSTFNR